MKHLSKILDPFWDSLETYEFDGITYYLGAEIYQLLGLSSITAAIGKDLEKPKVSRRNWAYKKIPEINFKRTVIVITYSGILEMIRNNKNARCKELQIQLDE